MKIHFLGAAQTVTGSCYIIETAQARFAVDCGMHQGNAEIEKRNNDTTAYDAANLDFILLTHAHIDHSGLLPRMAKDGFTGTVYCTEPTHDLLGIMLLDSAHIQEMEAEWANRKRARRGGDRVDPLYDTDDAIAITKLLKPLRYNKILEPAPGIRVLFRDAGHILGSAFLEMEIEENGERTLLVFSGDLGRPNSLIVEDPSTPFQNRVDYLFMESTYGDRDHKNENSSREELAEAIRYSFSHGEKTIIPAFAVERTQEIIYALFLLRKEGKLPEGLPIYVDSPLAIRATEIFRRHPEYFDSHARELLKKGEDPLSLPGLRYTLETRESQEINNLEGPAVVISASGMCNAGRIKHHLRHNLWRKGASVVFAGFQAVGTPGRRIVDGASHITILGEEIKVAAKIFTIGGFSAHAGQSQILEWIRNFARPEMEVFLVHGEEKAQQTLAGILRERFNLKVEIPRYREEFTLLPGKAPAARMEPPTAAPGYNWDFLLSDTEARLGKLREVIVKADKRSRTEQAEIQAELVRINTGMLDLLSRL